MLLYTKDPVTGDHLVVDGDTVTRCDTRAEALELCNRRHELEVAEARGSTPARR